MSARPTPAKIRRLLLEGYDYEHVAEHYRRAGIATDRTQIVEIASVGAAMLGTSVYIHAWIPWAIKYEHVRDEIGRMVRLLLRERAGEALSAAEHAELAEWNAKRGHRVVDYDPTTGYALVAPRPGIDRDWYRDPSETRR